MADYDLKEPLQTLPTVLDNVIREAVGEYLSWEGWDSYTRGLPFKDFAKLLKLAVTATDTGGSDLRWSCALAYPPAWLHLNQNDGPLTLKAGILVCTIMSSLSVCELDYMYVCECGFFRETYTANNLVICIHTTPEAMCLWIFDLCVEKRDGRP